MKRITLPILLAAGLAAAAHAAEPAQPDVKEIVVRNLGTAPLDESFVRLHTRVAAGKPLDPQAVGRDVKDLLATSAFAYVGVELEPASNGVRVVYLVRGKLTLGAAVEVKGAEHFRPDKIRKWLELGEGDLVDDPVLGLKAQKIVDEYRDDFYPDAKVTWTIEEIEGTPGRARVVLTVKEGAREKVRGYVFTGNRAIETGELRKAVGWPVRWNPLWWLHRRRYDADEIDEKWRSIRDLYLDRGYLDAQVDPPAVQRRADGRLIVGINVTEGQPYRVGAVTLSGVTLFPEADVRKSLRITTGQPASLAAIRDSESAMRDTFTSRGYISTDVTTAVDPSPSNGTANVHFTVTEGSLVHIGNIHIRGNERTRDKVIRRELQVYPGDILDEVRARRSERRLQNLGFFSSVRRYTLETDEADVDDLVYDVEEKRTGSFMIGAGFSSIDNIMAYTELSQGNFDLFGWPYFTGGGQKLKLRVQAGSSTRDYELSFIEPWFLNRRLSLGFDLYRHERDYDDYDLDRTGGAVSLSRGLPGANRITFRYELERSKIQELDDTNTYYYADSTLDPYVFASDEDVTKSTLRVTLTHDTRNDPFVPSAGNRSTAFFGTSGGPFGFELDMFEMGARSTQYVPLWAGHVLRVLGRYETIEAYGRTDEIPLSERLFVGGGRTIRGFDYRDVGPKVTLEPGATAGSYKAVGGQSLAMASLEYTIPLASKFRLAAFYDIGNVWRDSYDFDHHGMASGAGVGIRFDIPGFPIRIDRAWVVDKDNPLTDAEEWVIWIGYDW